MSDRAEPSWLDVELALAIHDRQLAEHGGPVGVRDFPALESALARPRNRWAYGETDLCALGAAYAFGIARNHPFADGNGRIARVMMNAELHAKGQERIIIPNVFRTEYLQSLKALTHNRRADGLVSVMDYAQCFVAGIDFSDYAKAVIQLQTCNAFSAPADAMGGGGKLILSEGADAPWRRK